MIKALIFDFDGLILDTETLWYEVYKEYLLDEYGLELPIKEFQKCVGADPSSLQIYLQEEVTADVDLSKLMQETIQHIDACVGVHDLIIDADKKGLQIALATSSTREWATKHLDNLDLLRYFDYLITKNDVKNVKPAPDLFEKALSMLGRKPNEAIVFEDSLNGLLAAKKVGLPTVIVPNSLTESLPFTNYDLKLQSLNRSLINISEPTTQGLM